MSFIWSPPGSVDNNHSNQLLLDTSLSAKHQMSLLEQQRHLVAQRRNKFAHTTNEVRATDYTVSQPATVTQCASAVSQLDTHREQLTLESPVAEPRVGDMFAGADQPVDGTDRDKVDSQQTPTDTIDWSRAVENLESFVLEPVPKRCRMVKCRITRVRKGVDRGLYPTYFLHAERDLDDGRRHFLLAARKRKKSATSNYLLSTDPTELSRDGASYIGKVRSNLLGTVFSVHGRFRSHSTHTSVLLNNSSLASTSQPSASYALSASMPSLVDHDHAEIVTVCYEPNLLGFKGPRKMTAVASLLSSEELDDQQPSSPSQSAQPPSVSPTPTKSQTRNNHSPTSADNLIDRWRAGRTDGLVRLVNKTPVWNEETQSYVLNFQGRVTQASIKNFQLVCADSTDQQIVMQFGRIAEDMFTMDFRYPFCALQAFGIVLSSFDGKWACE